MSRDVQLRLARPEDIPAQVVLSRAVYGARGAWKTLELREHHDVFPEGQILAESSMDATLLGHSASLMLDSRKWAPDRPWEELTGNGTLRTHDPSGDLLYGVGLAVHPRARGYGVARMLYRAREELLGRTGLGRIRVGARLPGYGRVAHRMEVEDYVEEVVRGERTDPTLSFQLHMGFEFVSVARGYLPIDAESRGHAAIVEWSP